MTLTAISMDRYFIINKPMKARTICTDRTVIIIVSSIWILSVLIMSPLLVIFKFESHKIYTDLEKKQYVIYAICFENWPHYEAKLCYEILLITALFILPIISMSYAYITVSKRLWFVKNKDTFEQNATRNGNNDDNDYDNDNDDEDNDDFKNDANANTKNNEKRTSSLKITKYNEKRNSSLKISMKSNKRSKKIKV